MHLEFKRLTAVNPADIIGLMNHPKVRAHMPLTKDNFSEADAQGFVQGKEQLWQEHGFGPWAFFIDGQFAGWGGVQPEEGEADLALVLHPNFWGAGGPIVREVLRRAFEEFKFPSVIVLFPPTRTRIRALFRLGFVEDGELELNGERFLRYRLQAPEKVGGLNPQHLLDRLEAIGHSLETSQHALALIGLGSVGLELARLDAHSDLDFFVIVEDGHKLKYINDLTWLERIAPVTYRFQNTVDGFKLLFADDVFCEFAVFELHELRSIPFAPGRIVWKKPDLPDEIAVPTLKTPQGSTHSLEWQLGEALTNLYIGLKRFNRGEKLSGSRFVQQYALDRVLALADHLEPEQPAFRDVFNAERRFEQRFPQVAQHLASFVQGYERTPESALAILGFLEAHFEVNVGMAKAIRRQVHV